MNAQIAQVAEDIFCRDCDHNYDGDKCVYCGQAKPVCKHERIDCYEENTEEYIGWHCLDCGEPVSPPAAVPIIDEIPY